MRIRRFVVTVAAILAWTAPCPAQPAADRHALARQPEVAAALTVLDAWIEATVTQREQPGLSVGIVYDQDLIWAKGYGHAELERRIPATPTTIYRIASISKLFTATAIMQLRDAGKLRLDDPISQRLPWFSIKKTYEGGPPITVRHLITHTSGLPREVSGVNWSDLTFPSRDDMLRVLPGQETVFPPQTEWKYSNLGVSLAGEIVAEVSGEPWAQYVERHILRPLDMTATRALPARDMPGLAVGYVRRVPGRARDVEPFVEMGAESPAANVASNVEDLAKFVSLQFRDGPVGGPQILVGSTLREMHRVQWLRPDWQSGWGLGFSVRRVGDQVRVGHSGNLPGHRTQVEIAPAQKLGVIVLANANDGDPLRYVDQVFRLVSPAVARAVGGSATPRVADPAWQRYVGRYAWKFAERQVEILNGELTMIAPEDDNPWNSRVILKPVGPHTFRIVAPGFSFGPIGELLTFEIDADGKVARIRLPNGHLLPIQ
jgi:D-alanyl-D-alanine carboxypeptidase